MGVAYNWSLIKLVRMIVQILENKFDCVIAIEGSRGLGKSTLAYWIAKKVALEFKKKGVKDYRFSPKRVLLYQRDEVIRFFHSWKRTGIADEMINVTFNRDFYDTEQKDLIKMINMNRDHCNLFLSCVPQFQNLDNQIKNLVKLRLTVVRRGVAIVQTPNRSIYSKDKWDQAINERIERRWIEKKIQNPHYAKLTTFRGILKFPKLTDKQEAIYQVIKNEKRNIVAKEQMGIGEDGKVEEEKSPVDIAYNKLLKGEIRNGQILDGIAMAHERSPESFHKSLRDRLKKEGKDHRLASYYWENKNKKGGAVMGEAQEIAELIKGIE